MPMHLKNTLKRYGAVAQLFHWAIVALIITQFVLALRAKGLSPVAKIGVLATHKSVGITILGLALLRLAWRLFNPVPPLPPGPARWQTPPAPARHAALAEPRRARLAFPAVRAAFHHPAVRLAHVLGARLQRQLVRAR